MAMSRNASHFQPDSVELAWPRFSRRLTPTKMAVVGVVVGVLRLRRLFRRLFRRLSFPHFLAWAGLGFVFIYSLFFFTLLPPSLPPSLPASVPQNVWPILFAMRRQMWSDSSNGALSCHHCQFLRSSRWRD